MHIAFFESSAEDEAFLKDKFPGHTIHFVKEPLSLGNVDQARDCEAISVFIYSTLTAELLAKLSKLRVIATRSTGFDHIDTAYCEEHEIVVSNVPSYGENTVAEHTFALILALSRNVHKSYARGLKKDYSIRGLEGFDLKERTLGVIGTGRIGLHTIRIAKGFGMHVVAYDINHDRFLSEILHFRYGTLSEVLTQSDIVTLHMPLNEKTRHFIGTKEFAQMRPGSLLINTSRGGIVDTDALIAALESGHLGGAGLDVLEGEELIKDERQSLHKSSDAAEEKRREENRRLLERDNVVFTPHIGFYSKEAIERILETTVDNLLHFAGKST